MVQQINLEEVSRFKFRQLPCRAMQKKTGLALDEEVLTWHWMKSCKLGTG